MAAFAFGLCASPVAAQSVQDEYNLASALYARELWPESIESFKFVIATFPNTDQAAVSHFFLGEACLQQGDFAGAYQAFQVFLSTHPHHQYSARAMFRLGEAAYRRGQHDQAIRLLELYVLEHPQDRLNEFALPYLGELRIKQNEPQLSQKAYETAILAYPESPLRDKCRLGLAKALQMQGSVQLAARVYQSIISDGKSALVDEARLQLGILNFGQRDYEFARQMFEQAAANGSDIDCQIEATYWLARTEIESSNIELALGLFAEVIGTSNNEALASAIYFDGAQAALRANQPQLAETWLIELREKWPDSPWTDDALQLQIEITEQNSRLDEALSLISEFHSAHCESPLRDRVFESEGRIHYQRDDFQKTVAIFSSLIASPNSGSQRETWKYLKSLGLIGLNRLAEAETTLNSIDLTNQTPKFRSLVEIAKATTYFARQKWAKSIDGYRNYLVMDPDGSEALRARAELTIALARQEQWETAESSFNELAQHHPGQKLVLDTAQFLAETALSERQNALAANWYQYLIQPTHPAEIIARGLSGLAWVQLQSNENELALKTFERLLNEYPESEYAADAAMARAKLLGDYDRHAEAAEMYELVIADRYSQLRAIAILRCAYSLQKAGGKQALLRAEQLLSEYIQLPGEQPTRDEAVYQLGWVYHDLNLPSHGIEKFELLVRDYPESKYWPDAAFRLVEDCLRKKDYDKAKLLIQQLLNTPTSKELLDRLFFLQGEIAAATDDWNAVTESMKSFKVENHDSDLSMTRNYWLAESLYRQSEFNEASSLFNELLLEIEDMDDALQPWIYLRAVQCDGQLDRWSQAKAMAKTASERYPDFSAVHEFDFVIGSALAAKGKFNNAIVAFQRVVDSPTGSKTETAAIAQWRIGECYFHQEKYEKAIRAYYRVDAMFAYEKWRAAALMQAGKCQERLGNWQHAAKLYQQLLNDFPKSKLCKAAEERLALASRRAQHHVESEKSISR